MKKIDFKNGVETLDNSSVTGLSSPLLQVSPPLRPSRPTPLRYSSPKKLSTSARRRNGPSSTTHILAFLLCCTAARPGRTRRLFWPAWTTWTLTMQPSSERSSRTRSQPRNTPSFQNNTSYTPDGKKQRCLLSIKGNSTKFQHSDLIHSVALRQFNPHYVQTVMTSRFMMVSQLNWKVITESIFTTDCDDLRMLKSSSIPFKKCLQIKTIAATTFQSFTPVQKY